MEIPADVSPAALDKIQKIARAEMYGRSQLIKLDNKLRELDKRIQRCHDHKPYKHVLKQRRKITTGVRNMFAKYVQRKSIQATKLVIQNFAETMLARHRSSLRPRSQRPRLATSGVRTSTSSSQDRLTETRADSSEINAP
ncbi:uncharacterized protein [Argopecten irradians]|uniref:uncharacterized protein isoform X2 n=1 Tax=Argopecten irradians TaxID=31199 RepID=UPI0037123968